MNEEETREWVASLEAVIAEGYTIAKGMAGGTHAANSPVLRLVRLLSLEDVRLP